MYETANAPSVQDAAFAVQDTGARLNWLLATNEQEAARRLLFSSALEEEELLTMRRPLDLRKAYALLGLLLGIFPPAAIFTRIFGYGLKGHSEIGLLIFCLLMNLICALVGLAMGSALSRTAGNLERLSWNRMLLTLPLLGMAWGAMTGGAGGFIFFGFGAVVGAVFAIPVGVAAFLLFTIFHRLLVRGGMIDARHFWPIASAVTLAIAALILNL
ncbi:MAG TPA: hypothetical protein VGB17_15145 [Pyrinomonadaceae bacterium]|jgi:hypothetical protein